MPTPFRRLPNDPAPDTVTYLLSCAAMARGCRSALAIDGPRGIDLAELDPEVPEDARVAQLIKSSGWRLDYGKWICGNHEGQPTADQGAIVPRAVLADLVKVAAYVSCGRSAVGHQPNGAPYPDAAARRALGALDDAGLLPVGEGE